jgi:hypothetical protein
MPKTKPKPKRQSKRAVYQPPSPRFLAAMIVKGWKVSSQRRLGP